MQIDKQLISRLELLARLELSDEEREAIRRDLNEILDMVEKLQRIDTTGIDPLVYLNLDVNQWRADEVRDQLPRERALRNAPQEDGSYFKVPKVIDLS
jgi:aspartyl-tRNA(Asn)/glutamyl-tRNA(Gln) amidotransferase subunit C